MNAPAAGASEAEMTRARVADRRQAEYFRRLLQERYLRLGEQIADHQRRLIKHQNRDQRSEASRMRRIIRDEERERDTVRRLMQALDVRFFTDAPVVAATAATPMATVSPL